MDLLVAVRKYLALLLSLLLIGCDALLKIEGIVVDESGKPIPQAKVWLIYENWAVESQTAENGEFHIGQVHGSGESLTLLVSKGGRRLFYKRVDKKSADQKITVILREGTQMMLDTPEFH